MARKKSMIPLWGALAVGAGALIWLFRGKKVQPPAPGPGPTVEPPVPETPVEPPVPGPPAPPVPPAVTDIAFESGGETELTLPSGDEFRVVWDPLAPWKYEAQDTPNVQAISTGVTSIRFHVAIQPPPLGVEQVFVQALAEDDTVMGEHKITLFGPES